MASVRAPTSLLMLLAMSCGSSAPPGARARDLDDGWVSTSSRRRSEASAAPATSAAPSAAPTVEPRPLESCGDTDHGFEGWLESFRRHAISEGISPQTVGSALAGVTYDREVIDLDRSQSSFKLSFEEFSAKRITRDRIKRGKAALRTHAELLARIEKRFGVALRVLAAIWGLETDYGENIGTRSSLRALATLAYDCRRRERFRNELASALRIVDRGDVSPAEMIGAWAGELGQTQFLPSSYERFAVDFDGDGRANLLASNADALASTARYLEAHGCWPHEDFHPGKPNFLALREWNASEVYQKTIVAFADRLGGVRTSRP